MAVLGSGSARVPHPACGGIPPRYVPKDGRGTLDHQALSLKDKMIRDLQYPEDARKELESVLRGLEYDASIAVAGVALSRAPLLEGAPDFSVPVRAGGIAQDQAVRREAPILFSRFAIISMVSRFEVYLGHLLLQRRVLEFLGGTERRMDGPNLWRILITVQQESKGGPVRLCNAVVTSHSSELQEKTEWLDGLYRVRNCLAHRLGIVQMIDVKPLGVPLDEAKDDDRLKAKWLRMRMCVNGEEVELPHYSPTESRLDVSFEQHIREWKIGDQIDVEPVDCQSIAISMSNLAQQIESEFEREMNLVLGLSNA
jgi:hypothetical protein